MPIILNLVFNRMKFLSPSLFVKFSSTVFLVLFSLSACGGPEPDADGQGANGQAVVDGQAVVEGLQRTNSTPGSTNRVVSVETVIVETFTFTDRIRTTGAVEANDDAVISSETSGRVLSIRDLGDMVGKGQALAQLDDRLVKAQYEAAVAGYELAASTLERLEALYADSIVSTQDIQGARAQYNQATAQRNLAEKQLQDVKIAAPFRGRVEERLVRRGELINPGMPVVRLVNTDQLRIKAGISEMYASDLRKGTAVQVELPMSGLEALDAEVSFVGQVIDPETRTFTIEVELENRDGKIKPDMIAGLSVERTTISDAIVIPRNAILRNERGTSVYVAEMVQGVKVASLVPVQTGLTSGSLVQITDGLSVGDEVVVTGTRILSLGDELKILQSESSRERAERQP